MTTQSEMVKLAEKLKPIIAKYEIYVVFHARDREKVEQILYDCFAEIYVLVQREAGTATEQILQVNWDNVLYHGDGKTLQERLDSHYEVYNNSEKNSTDRLILRDKLARIVRTEVKYITNTAMFYAIKNKAKFLVVHGEDTGIDCDCFENWGTFPVEDFDATTMLPPFHPDCECSFYAIVEEENE
jgi:hypothetical protein